MERELNLLEDGKLPPDIWISDEKWFPYAVPGAVHHIEVANARHCTINMITPSRSDPLKKYSQFYLSMVQMAKNLKDVGRLKFHGSAEG